MEERGNAEVFEFQMTRLELLEYTVAISLKVIMMQRIFLLFVVFFFVLPTVGFIMMAVIQGTSEGLLNSPVYGVSIIFVLLVIMVVIDYIINYK